MEGITSFSTAPLRWATGAGAIAAILGGLLGVAVIFKTLMYGDDVAGYPSLMATITFMSGVQLLTIGLLGEYVAAARRRSPSCSPVPRLTCVTMRLTAKAVLAGLGVILGIRLVAMAVMPFADTSEPRYAEIARIMAASGDWITPWFAPGEPFWGKPPLAFWAQAASGVWFGMSEMSLRLPSWLAMLGMLAILHELGRRLFSLEAARWAVLVFSTMLLPLVAAGAVLTDPFLALGITLGMASFLLAPEASSWFWRYGLFIGLAIGLLSKGPLALVLTMGAILPWLLWHGNARRYLRALPWASGTALTLTLTLPWYLLAEWKTPGFLEYFIVGEHPAIWCDLAGLGVGDAAVEPAGLVAAATRAARRVRRADPDVRPFAHGVLSVRMGSCHARVLHLVGQHSLDLCAACAAAGGAGHWREP
ncbi:hypothetical protein G6F65_015882 [Rhizopus arrhizus]|nr:hypothetical protein G6F65_015882 [Rhizopus arrhizus]